MVNKQQITYQSGKMISSVPLFSSLPPEDLILIEAHFKKRHFVKEQIILYEEDTCNYMYIVFSGKVRVVKMGEDGKEQIITIHKKNDFFGEMSLLDGRTSPATVIAHEDAVIGMLSREDFYNYVLGQEAICRQILELVCNRLREAWEMIKMLSFNTGNATERVISLLERLGERYGVKDERGIIIDVKMTHQQMASYASITRETMTRVLKSLEKAALISILDNKAILLNKGFPSISEKRSMHLTVQNF